MNSNLELLQAHLNQELPETLSPAGTWLRYRLVEAEDGEVTITVKTRPEMGNPARMLHGGMLCTICDEAMGISVFSLGMDDYYVSVDLNIDFLFGIPIGEIVLAKAKVLRKGKKIIHTECHIYNSENQLCAKASSNLVSTSVSSPLDYTKLKK